MIPTPLTPKVILEERNKATFEIEGLWPGYGQTVGNAIRRVLLSSLEGAAITSVKIDGVQHEFSTIAGVLEDMVELTLNLKRVRFRMHGDGPFTARIESKGDSELTARSIKVPSQLEVVNPEQHIATLTDKKSVLSMDITVEKGIGYQPVEARQKDKVEIGTIALDTSYSPLRFVNYEVENMRVGERTDYNRVRFHIETDGSVSPHEAFSAAAKILQEQFGALAGVFAPKERKHEVRDASAEESEGLEAPTPEGGDEETFEEQVLRKKIEELELSTRTLNALTNGGIKNVGMLSKKSEKRLKDVPGLGDKGVVEIKKALGNLGLTLKQ